MDLQQESDDGCLDWVTVFRLVSNSWHVINQNSERIQHKTIDLWDVTYMLNCKI